MDDGVTNEPPPEPPTGTPTGAPVRRVVVATDRTAAADRALDWAAALATAHGADLVAVRVVTDGAADLDAVRADLAAAARAAGGPGARARVAVGDDPAATIVRAAEDVDADVLVVGNSGMRGRKEFLLGNVANRVTHAARCTTVVVQTGVPGEPAATGVDAPASPRRAARVAEILAVLRRHGLREMLSRPGTGPEARAHAARLRAALEELGPTFGKLGQVLSTRPDLVPPEYVEELAALRSDVPPLTEAEVVGVMEHELGVPWEDVFSSIDPEPLAAGTIGQVHRARLDDGTPVVVKVQRPAAAEVISQDLALLRTAVRGLAASATVRSVVDVEGLFDQLASSLETELDFTAEADHLDRMREIVAASPRLDVPRCHRELSTARLLVMDEVPGIPVDEAPPGPERTEAATQLLASCFEQVLAAGFFHADPHPGNLLWADGTIWLIDLGMVGELDPELRRRLMLLLLAFWRGDVPFVADLSLGFAPPAQLGGVDVAAYEADLGALVASVQGAALADLELGPLLQQVTEISVRHRVPVPPALAMVGKALAQVQLTVAELAPEIDPLEEAGRFFVRDLVRRVTERADPAGWLYEFEKLRHRAVEIADALAAAGGARPGRRLEIGFASEHFEATVRRAGRDVAFGLAGGLALVGAAVAASSDRSPRWLAGALGSLGAGLTAAAVGDLGRGR